MSLLNESDDMKKLQQLPLEFLKCNRSSYQANPFLPTPIAAVGHDRNVFFAVVFFLLWSWVMYSIGNLSCLRSEMLIFQPTIFISVSDKEEFMKEVLRDGKTRITEWFRWGRDLLRSLNPTHPDQVQPPKAICPGLCPDGFWIFPKMETLQPFWATWSSVWSHS